MWSYVIKNEVLFSLNYTLFLLTLVILNTGRYGALKRNVEYELSLLLKLGRLSILRNNFAYCLNFSHTIFLELYEAW